MSTEPRAPSTFVPWVTTLCAITSFGGCFGAVADHSSEGYLMIFVLLTMVLIACAVLQWELYFRAYIAELLKKERQKAHDAAAASHD